MEKISAGSILHMAVLLLCILFNACGVESRRGGGGKYRSRIHAGRSGSSEGKDPLPWWVITLIFVGGVLGIFLCVVALKKVYEKKRQQKMRAMMSRRSLNIQRRRSQLENSTTTTTTSGDGRQVPVHPVFRGPDAPPTYDQSFVNDSLPPAYSKDVNTDDERAFAPATPTSPVTMDTPTTAPPSYDAAYNDGSHVVESGTPAVTMETEAGFAAGDPANIVCSGMQV